MKTNNKYLLLLKNFSLSPGIFNNYSTFFYSTAISGYRSLPRPHFLSPFSFSFISKFDFFHTRKNYLSHTFSTEVKTDNKKYFGKDCHVFFNHLKIQNFQYFKDTLINKFTSHIGGKENYSKLHDFFSTCTIKVCLDSYRFRSIKSQFTTHIDFQGLEKWDYSKSEYSHKVLNPLGIIQLRDLYFDYDFSDQDIPLNLDQLYTKILGNIIEIKESYDWDELVYLLVTFRTYPELLKNEKKLLDKMKTINTLKIKKNITNIKDIKTSFKSKHLPFTMNESVYGKKYYSCLTIIKNKKIEIVKKDKYFKFPSSIEKYFNEKRVYIDNKDRVKRVVFDLNKEGSIKKTFVYDLKDKLITYFIDEKIDGKVFKRSSKNSSFWFHEDKGVIRSEVFGKLPVISKKYRTKIELETNTYNKNIGSFDIETYKDLNIKKPKVYALGFAINNDETYTKKIFYIDKKNLSSDKIILKCIIEMLLYKDKTIYYTHNLGGFDIYYLLKFLLEFNNRFEEETGLEDFFKIKTDLKDDIILRIRISVNNKLSKKGYDLSPELMFINEKISLGIKNRSLSIVDSLPLLPVSLDNLGKQFSTNFRKKFFPYSFATNKTLFYEGITPAIDYYHTTKGNMKLDDYLPLIKENWNFKNETIAYLEQDLLTLLEIINTFNKYIFTNHNIEVTKNLTITSIGLSIFLYNHIGSEKKLGLITKREIYNDIKNGYNGGFSGVYKPYGTSLYYYDVNSLYPFCALYPIPGNEYSFIDGSNNYNGLNLEMDNLFGFFYCKVKTTFDYLGLLSIKWDGLLVQPNGEFEGWFFSPLIEYVIQNGYDVKIIKGYNFNKVYNVFDSYVKSIYSIKEKSVGAERAISKLLLNAPLGRFGMILDRKVTKLINFEQYKHLIMRYEISSEKWIIKDKKVLVTYNNKLSKVICEQHGLDYIDELNKEKLEDPEYIPIKDVSVTLSAAITAYSNIYMSKLKQFIFSINGKIYYTDTDSIVTDIKLPDYLIGSGLGKLKLEHFVERGYFISSKLYCLIVKDGESEKTIIKSKGVKASDLTEVDFIRMLKYSNVISTSKSYSSKNYEEGFVDIGIKNDIKLNSSKYRKRNKIYENNLWVDTKPLLIGLSTELVKWENKFSLICLRDN